MNLSSTNNAEPRPGHEARIRHLSSEGIEVVRVRADIRTAAYANMYKAVASKWPELVQPQQPNYAAVTQHLVANSKIVEEKFAARPVVNDTLAARPVETPQDVADPLTQAQQVVDAAYAQMQEEQRRANA